MTDAPRTERGTRTRAEIAGRRRRGVLGQRLHRGIHRADHRTRRRRPGHLLPLLRRQAGNLRGTGRGPEPEGAPRHDAGRRHRDHPPGVRARRIPRVLRVHRRPPRAVPHRAGSGVRLAARPQTALHPHRRWIHPGPDRRPRRRRCRPDRSRRRGLDPDGHRRNGRDAMGALGRRRPHRRGQRSDRQRNLPGARRGLRADDAVHPPGAGQRPSRSTRERTAHDRLGELSAAAPCRWQAAISPWASGAPRMRRSCWPCTV